MPAEQPRLLFCCDFCVCSEDACIGVCVEHISVFVFLRSGVFQNEMFGRRFMWCAGMYNQSAAVLDIKDFSKFFGPSARKHRLTVYRGSQVLTKGRDIPRDGRGGHPGADQ